MKYASVLMAAVIAIAIIIFSLSPPASTQEETSRWGLMTKLVQPIT